MNRRTAALGVLAAFLVVNGAYAFALPNVLNALTPAMPHGYREAESPTTDAGTTFVLVPPEDTGITFTRYTWTDGDLPYPSVIGGGVAAADVDGNGLIDLYFPPGGPHHPARLYLNDGNWSFRDATDAAGLNATGFGTGAGFGDYDNDGDADLAVFMDEDVRLYRNGGNATFTDATAASGVTLSGLCGARPCQAAGVTWLDADHDGHLDLFVVNNLDWRARGLHTSGQDYASLIYFAPKQDSVLFRNLGNGTFTEATWESGLTNTGKGLGATTLDVDGDGFTDVATANDITENALYVNDGSGAFRNLARAAGASEVKTSMGIAAGDVDGDGRPDLVVSNFRMDKLTLLVQRESTDGPRFAYETLERGLGASWRGTGWGVQLFDYDLDGWLDLAHAVGRAVPLDPHKYDVNNLVFPELVEDAEDQLYRNMGNGYFAEATYSAGADFPGRTNTRAILAVDLDNDGDEDLVRVNLQGQPVDVLRNDLANGHGSLRLDLEGRESNRDGFGARVTVTLPDGRVLVRDVASAAGYQTGLPGVLTVGLGAFEEARVHVRWPSGLGEDFGVLPAGAHGLAEGSGEA